jgi:ABC-2 type transport system permease protein
VRTPRAVLSAGIGVLFPLTLASNVFVRPPDHARLAAGLRPAHLSELPHDRRAGLMHGQAATGQLAWVLAASAALTAVFAPATADLYSHRR